MGAPIIGLAIGPQVWPFIVAVALVILILLVAVGLLLRRQARARPPMAPERRAVEFGDADVEPVDAPVEVDSRPRVPETQPPESLAQLGEESRPATAEAASAVVRPPQDAGDQLEERGAGENESPRPEIDSRPSEAVPEGPAPFEVRPEPRADKPAGESLVQRLYERPAVPIAAALVVGLLLRSILRRR